VAAKELPQGQPQGWHYAPIGARIEVKLDGDR